MSSDHLTIRMSLLGFALGFMAIAMSAAGWNHWAFIVSMFGTAAAMFLMALFWPMLTKQVGVVGRLQTRIDRAIGTKFLATTLAVLSFFPAIYLTVQSAQKLPQQVAPNDAASKSIPEPLTDTPIQKAYKTDFQKYMRTFEVVQFDGNRGQTKILGSKQVILDFDGNSKFLAVYIPQTELSYPICIAIGSSITNLLNQGTVRSIGRQDDGDINKFKSSDLKFSGAVYLYMESGLDIEQMASLIKSFKEHGAIVRFRDYSNTKK